MRMRIGDRRTGRERGKGEGKIGEGGKDGWMDGWVGGERERRARRQGLSFKKERDVIKSAKLFRGYWMDIF